MKKHTSTLILIVGSTVLVVGGITIAAINSNYAGKIHLKLGSEGIQLEIDGSSKRQ